MVTRLDRLARSTRDLLNTLAAITAKEAGFADIHRIRRGCGAKDRPFARRGQR
jgi:DNA invertase Pin-like site-specific DNA recombinase